MTRKSVSSKLRLEVPDHDAVVQGPRHELLHGGVEDDTGDAIFMASEGPLQCGILWLHV